MQEEKERGSWLLVCAAYLGLVASFVFMRLAIVSAARDPYLLGLELPRSAMFQNICGALAFVCGLAGLGAIGFVVDRGTSRQLLVSMLALPLVLILLEAVNMDF